MRRVWRRFVGRRARRAANQLRLALEARSRGVADPAGGNRRAGDRSGGECGVIRRSGIAAGALETIYGAHLAGARVSLNRRRFAVLYASDAQINFYVPAETPARVRRP